MDRTDLAVALEAAERAHRRKLGRDWRACPCGQDNPFAFDQATMGADCRCVNCVPYRSPAAQIAANEAQRRAALASVGFIDPVCACGEARVLCFELDHVSGQQFGDAVILLCRACHRRRTFAQQIEMREMAKLDPQDPTTRTFMALTGVAQILELLAELLRSSAAALMKAEPRISAGSEDDRT